MGLEYNNNEIKMSGMISENDIVPLREHLNAIAPSVASFDLSEAQDIHTAVLQLINAYNGVYGCEYSGDENTAFLKYLRNFVICENSSN